MLRELDESSTDTDTEASGEEQDEEDTGLHEKQPSAIRTLEEDELAKKEKEKQQAEPSGFGIVIPPQGAETAEEEEGKAEPGPVRVLCPECGESFDERGLGVHMARKHKKKKQGKTRYLAKTKSCPICGKRVAPQGLPNHMKKHEKEREAEVGAELRSLIQQPVSEAVEQILKEVPKIADQFLKNEEMLLRALQSNGWELKVNEEKLIILVKS